MQPMHQIISSTDEANHNTNNNKNDILSWAFSSTGIPAMKELFGLFDKHQNGHLLISLRNGKLVAWDVTVMTMLAESYINISATSATKTDTTRKAAKYVTQTNTYTFQPIALETLDPTNASAVEFL